MKKTQDLKVNQLGKGDSACWCHGGGKKWDCEKNAYWRFNDAEYCSKHLPKTAQKLKIKDKWIYVDDSKLSYADSDSSDSDSSESESSESESSESDCYDSESSESGSEY